MPPFELEQTLKSWESTPLLTTLNVTTPRGTTDFDRVNLKIEGFPAVTVTVVACEACRPASPGNATARPVMQVITTSRPTRALVISGNSISVEGSSWSFPLAGVTETGLRGPQ